jgi:hypothetical protein
MMATKSILSPLFQDKCQDILTRLRRIDYNQLTVKEKTDYDIFNDTLSTIVRGYEWRECVFVHIL